MENEKNFLKKEKTEEGTKIYLQLQNPDEEGNTIDLINVAGNMKKKSRLYKYLMALAICVGVVAGLLWIGAQNILGNESYASAVINLQYEGVEAGLDPNGAALDINKIKSPAVISKALESLSMSDAQLETIRQAIEIVGVVPEDVVNRITVIQEMALKDTTQYEKILDINYFPTQYIIKIRKNKALNKEETTAVLDAVLDSYIAYFMDTYANTAVLTVTGNLIDYENYDYAETIDMLESQIQIMQDYVHAKRVEAPDFRSVETGLSFGDIETALTMVEEVDLDNITSYVQNICLSKDKDRQKQYYEYKIRKLNMEIAEQQVNQATIQNSIDTYQKDPVVIVSSQESTQELTQTNEYYDQLVQQKIQITNQIAATNTVLNETYELLNRLNESTYTNSAKEYAYADEAIAKLIDTISSWTTLIEKTTEEYYSTSLFSNAVKVAVPASYQENGGLVAMAKKVVICVAVMLVVLLFIWGIDGLKMEITQMRIKKIKEQVNRTYEKAE